MKANGKNIVRWAAIAIAAVLLVLVVAAIVVVHTTAFQHFVLQQIEQKVQASTGALLNIGRMAINWRLLTLDFYGITLHGKESGSQAPLFAADHMRIGLKIVSILQRKVDLNEIVLDQPVAHLSVDRNGNSNLPQSPTSSSSQSGSSVNNLIDLAIQHVELNSGEIYYNDRATPLAAELHDFRTQIHFVPVASEYRGTLAYSDGRVTAKTFRPISHRLQLNFTLSRSGLVADPVTLTAEKSTLNLYAKMTNFERAHIEATYDGVLNTVELGRIAKSQSVPAGEVSLTGNLRYDNDPDKSVVDSAYLDGRLSSPQLVMNTGQIQATPKSIRAEFRLQDGNFSVRNLEADLLGGHVGANYDLSHLSGNSSSRVDAYVRNVSLQAMNNTAAVQNRQAIKVRGRVDGTVTATWGSSVKNAVARAHLVIRDSSQPAVGDSAIPLNGLIDVAYDGARNTASFGQSYLRTGNTTVSITGVLSDRSQLDVQANTSNLHEVIALASAFQSGSSATTNAASSLPDLRGSARFAGQVSGSVKEPRIKGDLSANDLAVRNARWRALHMSLDAASSGVSIQNGSLTDTQKGQINFSGHADLAAWSVTPSSPLSVQVTARQISISDLEQWTQSQYPVNGVLAANISIHGTEQNPQGQGSLQITQASAWNEPIKNLNVDFQGDGNSIHSNAQLVIPAGSLTAALTYQPKTQSYDVNLRATGVKLDQLQSVQARDLGIAGSLTLSADGHGNIKSPQFAANLQLPTLAVRDQTISDVQVQLNLANQRADFTLSSRADQGSIQAKGNVGLNGEYPASASLDIRGIPVAVVLAHYLTKAQQIQGQTEIHASLNGPLKNPYAIAAQLEIPTFSLNYQAAQLALVHPLRANYKNGIATIEQADLKGTGANLSMKGVIPIKAAVPLNVSANGSIDLSLLQTFATGVQSSGSINLNVAARGDLTHPAMQGKIGIVNAAVSTESVPVSIEGMNGQIQVSGNRLEIAQLSGAAGGGTISARGFLTYGAQPTFNLGVDTKSVRIRYPEGIRSVLSGNLSLAGNQANSQLTGRVLIDRLSFTQQFDLATFLGKFSTETPATAPSPFAAGMKLDVAIVTSQELNLSSSKVSLGGAANLTLTGTMAAPVVLGRATLNSGEMFFMGKRYEIQSGTIEFANPVRTVPVVNIYVKTIVQQYNITLNFVGPVDSLRTNYTSDPPLPPADIINLVAFGKTSEQAATSPSTPATLGAESVLAQGAASQLSGKLEKLVGISQLTIDPLAGNSQTNPGAQVAIQQRVTGNILLTFSTDVTSTQNQAIQVQYQVKRNLTVSVLRDQYGGYAADMRIHKTF